MKIFDCFIFFNELELLELRLMELYQTVDYFVLVEANRTHTGKPKSFIFEKNKDRFKKYLKKIIYVKVEDCPEFSLEGDFTAIEHFQRDAIMRGLAGKAELGDKILISDLDEIPRVESINANLSHGGWIFLQQDLFYYFVNCQVSGSCGGTTMADYGTFPSPQSLRRFAKRRYRYKSEEGSDSVIVHAGWHYSYLSGFDTAKIINKAENIYESNWVLHQLGSKEEILKKINDHKDPFGRTHRRCIQKIVDISRNQPKSMPQFLKKYPQFFYNSP